MRRMRGRSTSDGGVFVVQRHDARRLHYDLRLEMEGVLRSWAIPKTPPTEKGVRRLAIQVQDHPLEYAKFEGEIAEGHYGAGTVEVWDKGEYVLEKRERGKIIFELRGKKLRGTYCLIRLRGKEQNSWLFFKR